MSSRGDRPPPRFELVTRKNCHLCDEMAAELDRAGLAYTSRDVDREPALRDRFSDVVPVLLRDGKPVAKVRVDGPRLARLARRRR